MAIIEFKKSNDKRNAFFNRPHPEIKRVAETVLAANYAHDTKGESFIYFSEANKRYYAPKDQPQAIFRKFVGPHGKPIGVKMGAHLEEHEVVCWNEVHPDKPAKFCIFYDKANQKQARMLMPVISGVQFEEFVALNSKNPLLVMNALLALAKALKNLHYKVVHGDLHGRNVFLKDQDGSLKIKFIDFGLASLVTDFQKKKHQFNDDFGIFYLYIVMYLRDLPGSGFKINAPAFKYCHSIDQIIEALEHDRLHLLALSNEENTANLFINCEFINKQSPDQQKSLSTNSVFKSNQIEENLFINDEPLSVEDANFSPNNSLFFRKS